MKLNARDASIEHFKKRCRADNLKVTPQRIVIYRELLRSKDHPSAEVLFRRVKKEIPDISLDTVNRTLLTFSKMGLVNLVEGYGEARRFDPHTKNHHHFRCIKCNSIIDFDYEPYNDIIVPGNINKRYKVISKKVLLEGYCSKCRKNS